MRTKKVIIKSVDGRTKVTVMNNLNLQKIMLICMVLLTLVQLLIPKNLFKNSLYIILDSSNITWFVLWAIVLGSFWKSFYKEVIILDQDYLKVRKKVFITLGEDMYDISKVKNMYVQKRKKDGDLWDRNFFESEDIEYFIRFEYENSFKEFGHGISLKAGKKLITQHFSRFALSNDYDIFEP